MNIRESDTDESEKKNIQVTCVSVWTILTITKNKKRINNTRKNMLSKQGCALSVSNLQLGGRSDCMSLQVVRNTEKSQCRCCAACRYSNLSLLITTGQFAGETLVIQYWWCRFVWKLVKECQLVGVVILFFVLSYCLRLTDKRSQRSNVNAMDLLKNSHNLWNINYKKHLNFVAVCLQKNSKLENNRSGETQSQTNLNVEPRPWVSDQS